MDTINEITPVPNPNVNKPKKKAKIIVIAIVSIIMVIIMMLIGAVCCIYAVSKDAIEIEDRINNIDLDAIEYGTSFKELTLIRQDYERLSDFQKSLVTNYDVYEHAVAIYQELSDERTAQMKSWADVSYAEIAYDVIVESAEFQKIDDEDYFVVTVANISDKAKVNFELTVTMYNETWTVSSNVYTDEVDFLPQQTRRFEFPLDEVINRGPMAITEVDAAKVSSYSEEINGKTKMYSFDQQEIVQITQP